jgi:hypothetical protein
MWLDLAVLVLIVFLAGFGARAGAAAAGIRLVSLPLAYGGALLCAWAFGPALGRELGWSDMAGGLLAGTLGFVAMQALLWLATRAVRRRAESPPPASQALGALFGALRGALYALPLLWLAGLAEGARMAGVQPALPDLSGAQLPALGGKVIGAGVEGFVDQREPSGRLMLQVVSRPAETVSGVQQLLRHKRVGDLQRDPGFWLDVERGAVGTALERPTARALVADPKFRSQLARVGVVSPEAGRDPRVFQAELALALAEVGPKLEAIRSDPAMAALLEDPAVQERVKQGDTLSLLSDPRLRSVLTNATR